MSFKEYKGITLEQQDTVKSEINNLLNFEKQLPILMNNLRLNTMTWISRFDSDAFNNKMSIPEERFLQSSSLIDKTNQRYKFIMNGLSSANYLRKTISNILDIHLNN